MPINLQQQIKDLQELGVICGDVVDSQFDIMYYYDNKDIDFVINATIYIPENYPKNYPKIMDKEDLRRDIDWHISSNGELCLEHLINMRKFWKDHQNQTLASFVNKYVIPFYYEYYHRIKTGKYRNGEYSHGHGGTLEALSDLWGIPKHVVIQTFQHRYQELLKFMPQNEVDEIFNEMGSHYFFQKQSLRERLKSRKR